MAGEMYNGKCFCQVPLVWPIPSVFMDPEHRELAARWKSLWVGCISKLRTEQQLEMTQVSREAIPGNWFFSSGILIIWFSSSVPAPRASPAKPTGCPAAHCGPLCFLWGQQETHRWSEPRVIDERKRSQNHCRLEHQAISLILHVKLVSLGEINWPFLIETGTKQNFPRYYTKYSAGDTLSEVSMSFFKKSLLNNFLF